MAFKSVIALKYKDAEGNKVSRRANTIFTDIDPESDLAKKWIDKGFIRVAEVGEIAEAVAKGEISADALEASTGEKRPAKKAAAEKAPGDKAPADKAPAKRVNDVT